MIPGQNRIVPMVNMGLAPTLTLLTGTNKKEAINLQYIPVAASKWCMFKTHWSRSTFYYNGVTLEILVLRWLALDVVCCRG